MIASRAMNPAAEGTVYPQVTFPIDPARVAAFRRLFGQPGGVPPTFVSAAEFTALAQVIDDPQLQLDFSRVVHGSQEYRYERPLREGETIAIHTRLESIKVLGATGFLTIVMEMLDEVGQLVLTARSTMIERRAS